jgi:hypothetical protein
VMSNVARCSSPAPPSVVPELDFFSVRIYIFFCFQSSSASLCLFHLLRPHSFSILFLPEEKQDVGCLTAHQSRNNLLLPIHTRRSLPLREK